MYIVYVHTCTVSGKSYVGWAGPRKCDAGIDFNTLPNADIFLMERRWRRHVYNSRKLTYAFHCAIRKYGVDVWTHQVLEVCQTFEEVLVAEDRWITQLNTLVPHGYNMVKGGWGGRLAPELIEGWCNAIRVALARPDVKEKRATRMKRTQQIDIVTGEVIATFTSAHEASRLTGANKGNICTCARKNALGIPSKAAGFIWRYV